MTTVFHILILLIAGGAALVVLGWAVLEIIDFLRWIFPRNGNHNDK